MPDINRDISIEQVDYNIDINTVEYSIEINPQTTFSLELNEQGPQGARGYTGNGISSYELTSTVGLVDTYTITFTDGNTTTVNVTNGRGITSITGPVSVGNVDTYTINYNDSTTSTFTVTNGIDGVNPTVTAGTTTTGNPGTNASVVNSGTTQDVVLDFTIPRGDKGETGDVGPRGDKGDKGDKGDTGAKGDKGDAATIAVGTTTTGLPGTNASVVNSGTSSAAIFDFTIPRGDKGEQGIQGKKGDTGEQGPQGEKGDKGDTGATGPQGPQGIQGETGPQGPQGIQGEQGIQGIPGVAATIDVGTVTTGAEGTNVIITNSGTSQDAVFDFTIPRGNTGATGPQGPTGPTGPTGNGIASISLISTVGLQKTYRITYTDGNYYDFVVTDGAAGATTWGGISGVLSNQTDLQNALDDKQDALVSGSNIKTINSTSILGSGNISVATSAQGALADTALQPNDNISELTNNAGYITSSALAPYALSADLATVATSGSYNDLSNKPTIPDISNLANKDLSNLSATGEAKFQEPLVSGTNIKTINNNSILGSGNITIQSAPDIDNKSITTNISDELQTVGVIDSNNTTNAIKTWTGTKAQYNAIVTKDATTLYNITDDTDVTIPLLELLYPVGSLYIATSNLSVCPLSVLGVGTWQQKANSTLVTSVNSTAPVVGNGLSLGLTDGTRYGGLSINGNRFQADPQLYGSGIGLNSRNYTFDGKSTGVTTDPTKSGIQANITKTTISVTIWERIS